MSEKSMHLLVKIRDQVGDAFNQSSRLIRILFLLPLMAVTLTSCYEGWDYDRDGQPDRPEIPPVTKPIHYLLFQPIYPNQTAIDSGTCGIDNSYSVYRDSEWSSRIFAAITALQDIADTFVNAPIVVSSCSPFTAVDSASLDSEPWGGSAAPTQDQLERRTIHLTAVFWDGDVAATPAGFVRNQDWLAWDNLVAGGRNAQSLRYFVVSNDAGGYFSQWQGGLFSQVLAGQNIDVPNPTESGIDARNATIEADTEALISWVLTQSGG